jgi:hypothetical protein
MEYYAEDISGQSFLFSLTDGEKFTLKKKKMALLMMKNWISFGSDDLSISDKANVSDNYACMKQETYRCRAYGKGTKNAYLKFTGSESSTFRVSEWEAWRVEMIEMP